MGAAYMSARDGQQVAAAAAAAASCSRARPSGTNRPIQYPPLRLASPANRSGPFERGVAINLGGAACWPTRRPPMRATGWPAIWAADSIVPLAHLNRAHLQRPASLGGGRAGRPAGCLARWLH